MSNQQVAETIAAVKVGVPTVGTIAVWGMPLPEAAQFFLTLLGIVWWLWLFVEKIQAKRKGAASKRRRREDSKP